MVSEKNCELDAFDVPFISGVNGIMGKFSVELIFCRIDGCVSA